jgi:hypothetical protein
MEETQKSGQEQIDEQQNPTYELSLTGPGTTIKRKVDQDVALGIITLVMEGMPVAPGTRSVPLNQGRPATGVTLPRTGRGAQSVGEFLAEAQAKRYPDKIVAFGVYLEDYADKKPFTRDDIRSQFPRAGEGIPANFSRDFRWAVANKWVAADHGSKEEFFVTTTGRKALEAKFSDEFVKKTKQSTTRRRGRSKGTAKGQEAGSEAE